MDEKIQKISLGKLICGTNILELRLAFGEDTDLEPVYLLGNFGTRVTGKKAIVTQNLKKSRLVPL